MISEKDIQIGDWLHLEYTNSISGFVSFNFKVSQLRRDYGNELLVWGEKTPDGKHFGNMGGVSKIQPIPLTPEILEKNGFSYFHKNFASLDHDSAFRIAMVNWPDESGNGGLWVFAELIKIRYVHDLQHCLRLCGIDKEIVL